MVDPNYAREVAYATQTVIAAQRLGRAKSWKLSFLVDCVLSHLEQWFVQRTMKAQPFITALSVEALIEYYDLTQDPRVPGMLKTVADELWARYWDPVSKSFWYVDGSAQYPSNDTNLLIAPLYGWVFQQTGESIYRERGDVIFASGVKTAWLDGGKQFSMNYRWSPKYIEWRQSGSSPAPTGASVSAVWGTPQSAAAGAPFGSPLAALVKDKNGSPVAGASVTFTAPPSGASAAFAGAKTTVVTTNERGVAITSIPVANANAGSYRILATVRDADPAAFAMTNTTSTAVSVSVGSVTLPWNPQGLPLTLTAQIAGNAGSVNGGTVEFRILGRAVATAAVANGSASASYTLPPTALPGTLPVEASFSGWNSYPAASGSGSVTVVRRTPVITWQAPANITQGTPLGAMQLNARADVAGTFVYSPAAGTVLPVGARQALSTTFTPADTVRYASATATTKITVVGSTSKPPYLMPVSAVATREAGTGVVLLKVTVKNLGGPAASGVITTATLAMQAPLELPPTGPIAEQGTATTVLKFPATVPAGPATAIVFTRDYGASLNVVVP
jgi:hypothetical protein